MMNADLHSRSSDPDPLDAAAEAYVRLALALGRHDPDCVDAYFGPAEWRSEAEAENRPLVDLRREAEELLAALAAMPQPREELVGLRHRFLAGQLSALATRTRMLAGEQLPFDEEARALYDVDPPHHEEAQFEGILEELDGLLAAEGLTEGSLSERLAVLRRGFEVPPDRLESVFQAALDASREVTRRHLDLPEGETFAVEYVRDRPWSAYHWYRGEYQSLIQVNTDLPLGVDRALDLACHEGYPGHHVLHLLMEHHLVRRRGWWEHAVYSLFSPQALISEGTANFGIEVAFPPRERRLFETEVLFPLAGLDPARAPVLESVRRLADQLTYASNEAARRYLNAELGGEEAAVWLQRHAAGSPERCAQRIRFIDRYRSYIVNYNLGEDLVRAWVEAGGGTPEAPARRWELFGRLLSTPRVPSGLREPEEPRGPGRHPSPGPKGPAPVQG